VIVQGFLLGGMSRHITTTYVLGFFHKAVINVYDVYKQFNERVCYFVNAHSVNKPHVSIKGFVV